jgi:putative ABC transport system permease protein
MILATGFPAPAIGPDGREVSVSISAVDFGSFELYGLAPVAGRFFSPSFGGDIAPADRNAPVQPAIVVNEAFARSMGFGTPQEAVGQSIRWARQLSFAQYKAAELRASEIIGVVPDFARGSVREQTPATIFWVDPLMHRNISLKLDGAQVPETLAAIDALWRRVGDPRAIYRSFVDQAVQNLYLDLTRQSQVLGYLTAVAVVIAALGLFGLAAFAAEQRTKEIGIRKSMGATSGDILRLMLWHFARPVLWANFIAWPAAYFAMRRWLEGFAYRIDLSPWMFVAASALALVIALLTVIGHALLVARAHPVSALRYE